MDEFPNRKTAGGLSFSRKVSSGLVARDSGQNRDRNTQMCSRVGCSSRTNSTKGNQVGCPGCPGKAKTTRDPFRLSTHGKEVTGSSSRRPISLSGTRKLSSDSRKKLPSLNDSDLETFSVSEESEAPEPVIKPDNNQVRPNVSGEASSSSSVPHSRHGKKTMRRTELGMYDSSIGSTSMGFNNSNHGLKNGASASKYNLRNLKCSSINDVVPSGYSSSSTSLTSSSSSELNINKREMGRKRIGEAERSLSTRDKKINGPLLDSKRNDSSHRDVSISNSRRTRSSTFTTDNDVISVRTQRATARVRLNEREDRNRLQQTESSILRPLLPQTDTPFETNSLSSEEYQLPSQPSSNQINASGRPGSGHANIYSSRSLASLDAGFGSSFVNRESVGQYGLNGIAEMLLALDRIEQDEVLTYEQVLVLETNLFLSGLAFHDQHRDMRLDIDNMSYEDLLALEERMGTVSTALTEEALAKCLKKSIYQVTTAEEGTVVGEEGDDFKCSICQEEFEEANEVGTLGCEHQYHMECIEQWLRLKNWCPICKASAAPSPSASLSH